jgi:GTP1/Obg family GTP-binding protein
MSQEEKRPKEWTDAERESELLAKYKELEAKLKEAETRSSLVDKDRKVLQDEVSSLQKQNGEMLQKLEEALKTHWKDEKKTPLGEGGDEKKSTFKVVIAGCSNVGKTCLAHYFTHGSPSMEHGPTHGGKYSSALWYLEKKSYTITDL